MKNPVTVTVRELVLTRANNMCEKCGTAPANQIHHRRARGMGSTKRPETHYPSALLALCFPCHQWIESHRDDALHYGWLVRQGHTPSEMPVWIGWRWVLLNDDGTVEER